MIKNIKSCFSLLLLLTAFTWSCNPRSIDSITEDYDKIFPKKDIEQPDIPYEDMVTRYCDPSLPLEKYKYLGVDIPNAREYTVTLKCKFKEGVGYDSNYTIRYIGEDKKIHTIGSDASTGNNTFIMVDGKEIEHTFNVKSGYPMYLSVDGVGATESSINASIKAISKDGFISVPAIFTEQFQNVEGPNRIQNPFCNYIILP